MRPIRASGLLAAGNNLMLFQAIPQIVDEAPPEALDVNAPLDIGQRGVAVHHLGTLRDDCEVLGLTMTLSKVARVLESIERGLTQRQLQYESKEIFERLQDELDSRLFLALEASHVPYYEDFEKDWEPVLQHFPSLVVDIEEASKCFALNRYTAAAFHLMRVTEGGLRVLAATLHDDRLDPTRNPTWDRILQRCREEQAKPLRDRSQEWRQDERFFSGISARLMAVKDAWRNPTMHVEITYTEEMALDVFRHVQAFMRHLATKLSE